jgi:hypothetical protein
LPPELGVADVLLDELDELDDPPQATSARAVAALSNTAAADLVSLFTDPPPQRFEFPGAEIYPTRRRMPAQDGRDHKP